MGNGDLSKNYRVSLTFAGVGGFLEAYTFVTRDEVFANSQTGNIARLGINFAQWNFPMVFRYLIPVVIFVLGVSLSLRLKTVMSSTEHHLLSYGQIIVITEMLLIIVTGFIPEDKMDVLATALVSLVCAIQVESFRQFGENSFSSTMCTGNLRLGTERLNKFFSTGDRNYLRTALKYYGIDAVFAVFAAIGYWITFRLGTKAVWCSLFMLSALLLVFTVENFYSGK